MDEETNGEEIMKFKNILIFTSVLIASSVFGEVPLEKQLEMLKMPTNKVPGAVSEEKLYSVQLRHSPLSKRHEVSLSGARDFATDGYMDTNQVGLNYRYHFDDKWSVNAGYAKVFNELNDSGRALINQKKLVYDSDYHIAQYDVGAEYNLFYGKFRFGMDEVFYFDQYVGLSGGVIEARRGMKPTAGIDIGIAFWAGKKMSLRTGLKNNFFEEENGLGEKAIARNMVGYLAFGYFFEGV